MSTLRYVWLGIFLWCIIQSLFLVWKAHSAYYGYSKLRRKYFARLLLFGAFTVRSFLPAELRGDSLHRDVQFIWNYAILLPLAITWLHFDNVFILHTTAYTWRRLRRELTLVIIEAAVAVAYRVGQFVDSVKRRIQ